MLLAGIFAIIAAQASTSSDAAPVQCGLEEVRVARADCPPSRFYDEEGEERGGAAASSTAAGSDQTSKAR